MRWLASVSADGQCRINVVSAEQLMVDPVSAAHRLLGATLTGRDVRAVVVEVEAYGGMRDGPWPDAASHGYRGLTRRNAVTFGPPGRLYVYLSHGIHVCANVSCGPDGRAAAVLLVRQPSKKASMSPSPAGAICGRASHWRAARVTYALP
jgi:DNA-3-methyladenine glycosylase